MQSRISILVLSTVLTATACGGGNTSPAHHTPGPATYEELAQIMLQKACDAVFKCCPADRFDDVDYTDAASCVAQVNSGEARFPTLYAYWIGATLPAGWVYNRDAAGDCLATVEANLALCKGQPTHYLLAPGCEGVVLGPLKEGDVCGADVDLPCQAGLICTADTEADDPPYHCKKPVALGQKCGVGAGCDPLIAYCPENADGDYDGVCTKLKVAGEVCTSNDECLEWACVGGNDPDKTTCVTFEDADLICFYDPS